MLSRPGRIPLLVAAFMLAACDQSDPPTAPATVAAIPIAAHASAGGAERSVDERLFDVTGSLFGVPR
jgi:hypothetical protein